MNPDDDPWEPGRRYRGARAAGIAPLESLLSREQMWAVSNETLIAAFYLREGLVGLDNYLNEGTDFYPVVLTVLGQGVEHLLKLGLVLATLRAKGSLLSPGQLRNAGHKLPALRDRLVDQLIDPAILTTPDGEGFARASLVLQSSTVNDHLLALLEDHGRGARYFYLEAMLGSRRLQDPHDAFERWFDEVAEASRELYEGGFGGRYSPLAEHIIADRPGAYRRDRNEIVYIHLLGFLSVTSIVNLLLRADGWEGPLKPLTRIRTLRRLPKEWRRP